MSIVAHFFAGLPAAAGLHREDAGPRPGEPGVSVRAAAARLPAPGGAVELPRAAHAQLQTQPLLNCSSQGCSQAANRLPGAQASSHAIEEVEI